jgi:hypothetical protein
LIKVLGAAERVRDMGEDQYVAGLRAGQSYVLK